jgi:hypothetical protein
LKEGIGEVGRGGGVESLECMKLEEFMAVGFVMDLSLRYTKLSKH